MADNSNLKPTPRAREKKSRRDKTPRVSPRGSSSRTSRSARSTKAAKTSSAQGRRSSGLGQRQGGATGGTRPSFLDNRTGGSSVPTSSRSARQARARQVHTQNVMSILVRVLAVVACLVVVGAIAFFILRSTSLFTITSIEAVGSDHVSVEDIQNLIGVEEGTTLLNVDTNAIEANLKKNPWVESVDIEREFPDKLKVTVHERSVFAVVVMSSRSVVWYLGEGCVWIEPATLTVAEGQTTDDAALELANSVGAILITNVPSTVDPVAGSEATDDVIVAVNEYLDGFTDDFASQIVSFDTPSTDSISCVLSSGVEISLGSPTNISAKQTVIEELLARYPNQLTYINVRVPSNPSYRKIDSDSVQAGSGALSSDGSDETTSSSDSTTSESTTDQTTSSDSTSTSSDSTSDSSSSDQSTSSDQSSSE